jgi:hypothetical protein
MVVVPWHKGLFLQLLQYNSFQTSIGIEGNNMATSLKNFYYNIICKMPSMYQQNAINTYVKYVSIKMLHTCHAMQFVTILCHMIAYQQNASTYAKYVSIKMLILAMQSIAIPCHIITYQQILQNIVAIL